MYLKYVQIVNFKNLKNVRFEFSKGANTIIGENDSGKSNALTAIRILLDDNYYYNTKRLKETDFSYALGDWKGHWIIISAFFDEISNEDKHNEFCAEITPEQENIDFLKSYIRCTDKDFGTVSLFIRPCRTKRIELAEAAQNGTFEAVRSQIKLSDYEFYYTSRSQADFTDENVYKSIVGDICAGQYVNPEDDDQSVLGCKIDIMNVWQHISTVFIDALRDVESELRKPKNPIRQIIDTKDRYELDKKCDLSIQEYVSHTQIYFDSMVQDKCYGILDYLYSIIKNDAENAQDYLQIQKMDMRGAKATKITDNIIMLEPQISGEAEKIVLRQEEFNKPKQRLNAAIKKCNDNMVSGQIDLPSTLDVIKVILELMKDTDMAFQYENLLILLIASAINHQELENEKREKFCTIWINGIEKLFSNGSFLADIALMPVLLNQLENDVASGIKNKIKKIVLDCLMYKGQHGVIDEMAKYVKRYLANHETLAQAVFNTIIKLSEDQMEHQKYNANYLKVSKKDKEFIFNPNMQPKLSGIDRYIKDDDGNCYTSREEEIIDRYLLQEESLEIDVFDMSNYDISTICYVANCGLNFTNESFRMVIHEILLCVIDIWKYTKRNYNAHEIFDVYQEHEIIELFQREMIQTQDDAKMAIDILFEEIDFTKFTTDTIEFYQDIFGNFLCEFFDSYVDSKRRNICKKKILYIEKKVNDIDEEYVRIQLYKSLMLSVTRYCTGDWSKIKTNYSYVDKQFLNKQFTKYGKYHIKELLRTIYQMHMDELLPEILISIRNSFQNAKSEVNKFKKSIREQEAIVQLIILKSFITYSDKIKQDQELIEAYEDILEILINLNYEQAAVILDEFRIH